MREFFKGWRRKVGVVTLATTVLIFGMWMRSYLISDSMIRGGDVAVHIFGSLDGSMSWTRYPVKPAQQGFHWRSIRRTERHLHGWWQGAIEREVVWRLRWGGFNCGTALRNLSGARERADFCLVPYWLIVLPLTLLSAWLLLTKPRPAKTVSLRQPDHA